MGVSRESPQRAKLLEDLVAAGRQLSTATVMFHQAIADRLGLNVTDHKCMDLLLMKGPLTAGELAAMTGLTTGAITAVIDRLERSGFARREDDPRDRRRVIVQVVPRRCRDIERLFEPFAATFGELGDRYSDEELVVILDFMTRSREGLHQSTVDLRQAQSSSKERKSQGSKTRKGTKKKILSLTIFTAQPLALNSVSIPPSLSSHARCRDFQPVLFRLRARRTSGTLRNRAVAVHRL